MKNDEDLKNNVSYLTEMLENADKMASYIKDGHLGNAMIKALSSEKFLDKKKVIKIIWMLWSIMKVEIPQVYLFKLPSFTLKKS